MVILFIRKFLKLLANSQKFISTKLPDPVIRESLYNNKFALFPTLTFLNAKQALFGMYLLKPLVYNIYTQPTNYNFKLKPRTIVLPTNFEVQNKYNLDFCESSKILRNCALRSNLYMRELGEISVF